MVVGKKSKKSAAWKFTLDLTHPVEDGILDSANFVCLLWLCASLFRINKMFICKHLTVCGLGRPSLAPARLGSPSLVHHCALSHRKLSSKRGSRWTGRRGTWAASSRWAAWRTRSMSRQRSSSPNGEPLQRPHCCSEVNEGKRVVKLHVGFVQVPEVPDQEVPEEEQPEGLAEGGGVWQGDVRAALLPDQSGRRGVWGRRVKSCSTINLKNKTVFVLFLLIKRLIYATQNPVRGSAVVAAVSQWNLNLIRVQSPDLTELMETKQIITSSFFDAVQ